MVLESIISVKLSRRHPSVILLLSIALSSVGIWTAYYLFPESSSILALAFVTIGMMPIIYRLILIEETEEAAKPGWAPGFIWRHFDLIQVYSWFFIGLIVSYSFWFVVLPPSAPAECSSYSERGIACLVPAKDKVFSEQSKIFSAITGRATIGYEECKNIKTKSIEKCSALIFRNNWWVMLLAVLLSFFYGAGAIFLIGWNASIIGLFIGMEIQNVHWIAGVLKGVGYMPHGIWEVMGYFIGAIAGGIISAAISKKKYMTHEFETIAKDVLVMISLATVVLIIGAVIEAWLIVGA